MKHTTPNSPRGEHQQRERERVNASPTLAEKYKELTALTVDLGHYDPSGEYRCSQVKYTVNLNGAKAIFCFSCENMDCVDGDYDLTNTLARAIAGRQTEVTGETRCPGWRSRTTMGSVHCENLLRYRFILKY
jgi:hypothetical protein